MKASLWQRIKSCFDHPIAGEPAAAEKENPILSVLGPLEALRDKTVETGDTTSLEDRAKAAALEEERKEARARQQEMLEDILKLHQQLNTGLSQAEVEHISTELLDNVKFFAGRNTDALADQGLLAIMHSLQADCLEFGWLRLNEKLKAANLEWPLPAGLSPNAKADDVQAKRELQFNRRHKDFCAYRGRAASDVMLGRVAVWRSVYPDRGGSVWTSTVFEAVGLALAARRLEQAIALAHDSADALRDAVANRLKTELQPVQDQLAGGVSSLAQARSLSDQATEITQNVATEEFWSVIRPKLNASAAALH